MKSLFSIIADYRRVTLFKSHKTWGIVEPRNTNLMAYGICPQSGEWERNERLQATVSSDYDVYFFPIDHNECYEATVQKGELRCDGLIYSEDKRVVVFIELKDRVVGVGDLDSIAKGCIEVNSSSTINQKNMWLSKATLQLRDTILRFNITDADVCQMFPARRCAYIANRKIGYGVNFMAESTKEEFKKQTGFDLRINTEINIPAIPPPIRLEHLSPYDIKEMTS